MPRIKKPVVSAPNKDGLPEVARTVALSHSRLKKIEAEMEEKLNKVRASYQGKIDQLRSEINEGTAQLEAYALENKLDFEKKKSMDVVHGRIGFRIGTPKVKLIRGLSNKIVGILEAANVTEFLRTKKELDKEKIISSRQDEAVMKQLGEFGISVEQDETFFFEPKEEEVVTA